jgi:hypothetical protein
MFRLILALILTAGPLFAKSAPDFNALKKNWGKVDSVTINKSNDRYNATITIGKILVSRDLYMITPQNPELLLWIFHGYKPEGDPYKQSPEIFIKNLGLKDLSSWFNALVIIVDSGASLYSYSPESGMPELQIYNAIYDKLAKQYGSMPVILAGISSGAEGAVKFAPLINNLRSLICISGTYNFDSLAADSGEYKMHIKEYGSKSEWEYEQPVRILPLLKCNIILLSEENSIYRAQTKEASRIRGIKKIEFIESIGKGKSHDWNFWGSEEVKKIINREVQGAGAF